MRACSISPSQNYPFQRETSDGRNGAGATLRWSEKRKGYSDEDEDVKRLLVAQGFGGANAGGRGRGIERGQQ